MSASARVRYCLSMAFESLKSRYRRIKRNMTRGLAWDIFMVYLAVINLSLILFDMTYLWLRPTYFRYLPVVTRIYDPVKGIGPHPLTEAWLVASKEVAEQLDAGVEPYRLAAELEEIRELAREVLINKAFERSGQVQNGRRIWVGMARFLRSEPGNGPVDQAQPARISDLFWSLQPDPSRIEARSIYFNHNLAPLLAVNYLREFDLRGQLTDYFWLIDLPFWLIFATEFFTRWWLAYRRGTYDRWFFFPIFNWYDLLGIVPLRQFRAFRLFRIVSIYVRLHRSEHSTVGDDIVSRTVGYFANIISEEVSDMVSLRILNETEQELADGTHKRIVRAVTERHREALAVELANQIGQLMISTVVREQARGFLDSNLEQAVDSAEALRRIPLPDVVLQPLVLAIGRAVFDAIADTLAATLASDEGNAALRRMIADAIDGLVEEITDGELEALVREISIEVIGHLKETVAVRKWTLKDEPRRGVFTRELID